MKLARLAKFVVGESGATTLEYGLICSLIFLAAVSAFVAVGESLDSIYEAVASNIGSAM
jgi:pilus assembly protein Flp/PilA